MSRVVVVGSANMDLVVRQPRLPRPGETMFGSDFATVAGGKGLNQAVAAALAGAEVEFVGAVGVDAHGEALRAVLVGHGVGVDGLRVVDAPTGTAHISVVDGGENSIVVVPGANAEMTSLQPDQRRLVETADWVVMQFELPQQVLLEAAEVTRGQVALTPAPVAEPVAGLLDHVDLLALNAAEAEALAGVEGAEAAAGVLAGRVGAVVVTLGADGALLARRGLPDVRVPAQQVEAVDTTGAGDAFVGAAVARLGLGADLETAVAWAGVAAALSVTRAGASSSMPSADEVEAARP